jgi:voltage-gated sodium channel
VIEIALKLVALGGRFFRSGWNLFDFVIVGIALVPGGAGAVGPAGAAHPQGPAHPVGGPVAPARGGGVDDRASRDGVGVPPDVDHLLHRRGDGDEAVSDSFPEWFGTLGDSLYTLFQIMTLESWSMGIVRPVLEVYPYAWAFFVPFIMVTTFAVVNLIVGLVVNSMQDAHAEESNAATDAYRDEVLERLKAIEERLGSSGRVRKGLQISHVDALSAPDGHRRTGGRDMGGFERFLSLWVLAAILAGLALGRSFPASSRRSPRWNTPRST